MSECENANLVGADAVHNLIGETRDEHATSIERSETQTGFRGLGDAVKRSENRVGSASASASHVSHSVTRAPDGSR